MSTIKQAQGPFESMDACIAAVVEEEGVDEDTARQICEDMDGDDGGAPQFGEGSAGLHELESQIIQHQANTLVPKASQEEVIEDLETDMSGKEFYGDRDPVSGDLSGSIHDQAQIDPEAEIEMLTAQRQPGESMGDCVSRVMEEEDVDEETAREACAATAEEASLKQAQRKPGETMGDCISRVMDEEDVDRATAREACREIERD